jgi:hypothetical protein
MPAIVHLFWANLRFRATQAYNDCRIAGFLAYSAMRQLKAAHSALFALPRRSKSCQHTAKRQAPLMKSELALY